MVHGFSRVVIEVLKFAARSTRLTIFVAESMPNREGCATVVVIVCLSTSPWGFEWQFFLEGVGGIEVLGLLLLVHLLAPVV